MVKVGDKIRVTIGAYTPECPRGTICTVTSANERGGIRATIDGGDMYEWFFCKGQYEPYIPEPEPDYAAKAAQYGICITVYVGGYVVTYDGRKCQAD